MRLSLGFTTSLCWSGILLLVAWHVVLKPRRLYVDENALLVNAGNLDDASRGSTTEEQQAALLLAAETPEAAARFDSLYNHRDADNSLCRAFRGLGASFCDVLQIRTHAPMLQATIDAPSKPQSAESSVVVFLYSRASQPQARAARSLALRLANDSLHAPWLAKRIVLLLLPTDCPSTSPSSTSSSTSFFASSFASFSTSEVLVEQEVCAPWVRHSPALAAWLRHSTHLPYDIVDNAEAGGAEPDLASPFLGVVRDALVVDMSSAGFDSEAASDLWTPPIILLHTGLNGNLPNMDMITAPLAMFPSFIALPALGPSPALARALAPLALLASAVESLGRSLGPAAAAAAADAVAAVMDPDSPQWLRIRGLLHGTWRQATGPDGLHSLFLQQNIDSITLRVRHYGVGESTSLPELHLACVLLSLLRASSSLSEELHHSHFFYLPLDARHFWGLQEWAPALALGLLPLVLLSWRLAVWRPDGAETRAVIATGTVPAAAASDASTAASEAATVSTAAGGGSSGGGDGITVASRAVPFHSRALLCSLFDGGMFFATAAAARLLSLFPPRRGVLAALDVRAVVAVYTCLLAWIGAHGMSPKSIRKGSNSHSHSQPYSARQDTRRAATSALYLSTQAGLCAALLACLAAQAAPLALLTCALFTPLWAGVSALVPTLPSEGNLGAAEAEKGEEKDRETGRLPAAMLAVLAGVLIVIASAPRIVAASVFEWGSMGNLSGLVLLGVVHVGIAGLRVWRG